MTSTFQIRRSSKAADTPDAIHFEIEHVGGERKRAFIVLDLSDSTRGIIAQLASLSYLWRLLPPQWRVSLYALSSPLKLPISPATSPAGDIGGAFDELRTLSPIETTELRQLAACGSFLRPTLAAIEKQRADEAAQGANASLPAIIFVVTDGELLDVRPVPPLLGAKVIGILLDTGNERASRWKAVVPGSPCFTASDTTLSEHVKDLIYPDARKCTITLSLAPKEPPELHSWDFVSKGKYELDVLSSSARTKDAFIECRTQSGESSKWLISSLFQGETDELLSDVSHAGPATVASGALHEVQDDSLIHALREHATAKQSEQSSWSADVVRLLATHVAASSGDHQTLSARPHALLAVFFQRESGTGGDTSQDASAGTSRLLLGLLYKDRSHSIYIPRGTATPTDPGFSAKEDVHILWDNNEMRFAVLVGDSARRDLRPHESEPLDYFVDGRGCKCTAFYSGYIDWPT